MNPAAEAIRAVHEARMAGLLDDGRGFRLARVIEADLRARCPSMGGPQLAALRDEFAVRTLLAEAAGDGAALPVTLEAVRALAPA